jgi:hypothetical protein
MFISHYLFVTRFKDSKETVQDSGTVVCEGKVVLITSIKYYIPAIEFLHCKFLKEEKKQLLVLFKFFSVLNLSMLIHNNYAMKASSLPPPNNTSTPPLKL